MTCEQQRVSDVGSSWGTWLPFTDGPGEPGRHIQPGQRSRAWEGLGQVGWRRSQGVGYSSLLVLALAWWPPGVASFWAADNLGEFQVVEEGVSRPPGSERQACC